ncbi:hypothetical protein D6C86_02833 [Aureobasidium pullulans]|nr:hypothetical protein D6C86_02833 [Aureobasidium pullulans]THZ93072.1 hypothetical protein D6C88_02878 [Aureobasidium pullulans]
MPGIWSKETHKFFKISLVVRGEALTITLLFCTRRASHTPYLTTKYNALEEMISYT